MINIYKLTSKKYPHLIYIGRTENVLNTRLSQHKLDAKNNKRWCSSCRLANKQDVVITLLRVCNEDEGVANEQLYMILAKLLYRNGCINDKWAIGFSRAYYHKKWSCNKNNLVAKSLKAKEGYKCNQIKRDIIASNGKKWYKKHRDRISLKYKEKITCECGSIVSRGALTTHKRSQKHINNLANLKKETKA